MSHTLCDGTLSSLSGWVAARMGLYFPRERWGDLERKTAEAAKELGFADVEAFVAGLSVSPLAADQVEMLASHLTVAETSFWREPRVFEALAAHILPELIRSREKGERRLRIWSAGCATGEEPYSIAIALRRLLPAIDDWHITILATDINPRLLRQAITGVYREWAFRNAPSWLTEGYFARREGGLLALSPEIRKMVTFAYLNLAEDIYPSPTSNTNALDIIFCRNVLMYFSPERARLIGQNLYHCLIEDGWLVVSACELSQVVFAQFASVHFPGAIVYRKAGRHSRSPAAVGEEGASHSPPFEPPARTVAEVTQVGRPASRRGGETVRRLGSAASPPTVDVQDRDAGAMEESQETSRASLVRELANQGKLAEALAACDLAIAADKLDPGLRYLRATILQEQDSQGEAIAALKRALYLDPGLALAHFTLGNLMLRQGNAQAAEKYFENVLSLLRVCGQDELVPESDGLTAGRLGMITRAAMQTGVLV